MQTQPERYTLYERVAQEVMRQIESGTFRAGEQIPSIRKTCQKTGASFTTVLQAYHFLQDRGWIESRPQSGYYVLPRRAIAVAEPDMSPSSTQPLPVTTSELFLRMLEDTLDPSLVQFGAALPDPALLPNDRLNRILVSVLRQTQPAELVQVPSKGAQPLRVQIAQRAFAAGCDFSPEDVVITSGCMEALNLCLRVLCRPGDMVAIESPSFAIHALESHQLQAVEIPTHPRQGINLEALRAAIDQFPIRACLSIPNFNNPLGSCMPNEAKKELVELLAKRNIPLIEDDLNGELYFSGQRPIPAKAYDRHGMVMLCSSFSKDISPSYRVGWVAAGKYCAEVERLKMVSSLNTATLPQLAIAQFLAQGGYDHHLRKIRKAYAQKVTLMAEAIAHYFPQGTRVSAPSGGFVLWVQLPEGVDSLALYQRALQQQITLAPGSLFSATSFYRNYIRLNAAFWSANTAPALERLANLASQMVNQSKT